MEANCYPNIPSFSPRYPQKKKFQSQVSANQWAVFSSRKSLGFDIVAHFVITW